MVQKVFVTGATGVLGRRVVPRLVAEGHRVTAVARTAEKAESLRAAGATPVEVDLFDRDAVRAAIAGHDSIAQLATHIPSGPAAAQRSAWQTNDALRGKAAPTIAAAAIEAGVGRFVQESITFPYVDGGDEWIDEQRERVYSWGNECTVIAEQAAADFTAAGGVGIVLRFALFMAPDSAHTESFVSAARRGHFAIVGDQQSYVSFIHIEDAAAAVAAALQVPAGTYNVAEPDPVRRSAHAHALARLAGRSALQPVRAELERVGGQIVNSLARSHRISPQHLRDVSAWTPAVHCVDHWGDRR